MSAVVLRQVEIVLTEKDVKRIISDHINENKNKYGVKEVFKAEDVNINFEQTKTHVIFQSITAISKSKENI